MPFEVFAALVVSIALPGAVLAYQASRRRLTSLVAFYSLLLLLECLGGAAKALLPGTAPFVEAAPVEALPRTLAVLGFGYALFLIGYATLPPLFRAREVTPQASLGRFFETRWTPRYRGLLFGAVVVTLFAGFVQHAQRVRAAGGVEAFLETAYQYRFGSLGESDEQNALIVTSNMVAPAAVGLFAIVLLAGLRGRLSRLELALYGLLFAVLLLRQWSSMFRSVLWFTLVSLIAVYDMARPLRPLPALRIGAALLAFLAAINFGHQYLFHLTADWDFQSFTESLGHLIAPQNQLYTLNRVLETWQQRPELLGGQGFLESIAFFVPRWLWSGKAPYFESGTLLVQSWAGLPTWYQLTITNVGELIAHFGLAGMLGLLGYGWWYRWLDERGATTLEWRVAHLCALLPRVPADLGSGLSALAITAFGLALFLGVTRALAWLGAGAEGRSLRDGRWAGVAAVPPRATV